MHKALKGWKHFFKFEVIMTLTDCVNKRISKVCSYIKHF